MLDSFLTFINQHTPDLKQHPTLLAVSGGIDSVVMAHLFHSLRLPAGIAHCNFGLRGEESDGDEAFVRELAVRYNFPFFVTGPDVKGFAKSASVSTQMAARTLRYDWFEKIRMESDYQWIATAHHANDSLETLLLNLTRGTGLAGLTGIAPVNGNLIRPLLYSSRTEISRYAAENGIGWREDRTNQTDDYYRNKIRHHVIPVLSELNPSLETTFNASSERLRASNALLEAHLQEWKSSVVRTGPDRVCISVAEIAGANEPLYRLWAILQEFGFQYSQMHGIMAALNGIPGKHFFSSAYTLLIDRAQLIIEPSSSNSKNAAIIIERPDETVDWNGTTLALRILTEESSYDFDQPAIVVDLSLLTFPLTIRKWQQGDVFQPFGMNGKRKKVSDLLIDNKIDRLRKEKTAVLLNGNGEIIWVVGIRADERFKVTVATGTSLMISLNP
ncbi:MAG: tRNA lysidine(34) synthetase TilS [Dyadobacter sp. 50-39]|uniref:tRNA lysidine(34) synthetase TilS n=1 Tax=Dyadobacter sp. 50-39 TaxID=1895756 RepID=UPI00095BF955|nr:tRNA lysidine(34) synthetase TilS [Dyadobacter sp. 50-39]OJV16430.1 MAG: tRNA lysidine(34) synthetase TilS [Dyadobacter sp. 50-39]